MRNIKNERARVMAQIRVKTYDQLWQAMSSVLTKGVDYTGYIADSIIKEFIQMWYGDYDPKHHIREFQLFQALFRAETKKMPDDSVKTYVFIEPSFMKHTFHDKAQQLTEEDVINAANEGLHGAIGGTVVPGEKGIKFWDDAIGYMKSSGILITEFVRYLRTKGYDIHVK